MPPERLCVDADECEFLNEESLISVVPKFTTQRAEEYFCGTIGPFEAGMPIQMPLWLAMYFRRRHQCKILPPPWLSVEELKRMSSAESASPMSFTKIPEEFFAVSRLLISKVASDIPEHDLMMPLVKDIWDKRMSKMRTSAEKFLSQVTANHGDLTNLTAMEVCYLRAFMCEVTDVVDKFNTYLHMFQARSH